MAALAPSLTPGQKAAFARTLTEAGLLRPPAASADDVTKEVQTAFGLDQPPSLERVTRLLGVLADMLEKLDQVACKTYENLPARQDFSALNALDLREAITQFLAAQDEAGDKAAAQSAERVFERHRRAMVALMASHVGMKGVPSVGRDFARWFLDLFSPQNIEDVVRSERGNILGFGVPERCWRRYVRRFREDLSTQEHVDKRVKDAVANTAEHLFQLRV
jgi:hypothetical protein